MLDADRFKFIGGPYQAPAVRRGDELEDALRGPVTVCSWSQGPIAWPRGQGATGRVALVLTGDLVAAVRLESSQAIQRWWGVSHATVHRWRQALGVGAYTAGTRRLHHDWTPETLSAADVQRGQERGASLAGRAKMTARLRARGYCQRRQHVWTPDEEALLGTRPDAAAAAQLGLALKVVGRRRRQLGIASCGGANVTCSPKSPHSKVESSVCNCAHCRGAK